MNSLVALGLSALLAIMMLTSQSASANNIGGFDCFGQSNCVAGWNDAIVACSIIDILSVLFSL
jgi:hypothetical protein